MSERMKVWRSWASVGVAGTLTLGLLGCGGVANSCQFDADCSSNEACVQNTCRQICAQNEDCASAPMGAFEGPFSCSPFTREGEEVAINVCIPQDQDATDMGNPTQSCTTNEDCVQALGSAAATCSLIKTCILPPVEYGAQVRALSEAGAQLLAIYVEDERAQVQGWAVSLEYEPVGAGSAASFDGSARALEAECVASPQQAQGVMLGGEGGSVRVYFVDEKRERITLESGWRVRVIERGQNCSVDEVSDEYEVRLCVSRAGEMLESSAQCERVLASPVSGAASALITLP